MPRNVSHVAFERRIKVLNKSLFIRYSCFQQTALARVTMLTGVIQVILVLWFVTPCKSDVCSQKICQCTKFGRTQLRVICRVRGYIPAGIPSNTIEL